MNILWPVIFALLVQTGTTASVEGIVVKLGSGEPLARATVALWNDKNTAAALRVTTAADGRFMISNIQPGEYRLMASHSGPYMPADYGQSKPARRGTLITFTAGQKITGVQLALAPTSSISGRILDNDGEPLGRVEVQALQSVYQDGRKVLKIVQSIMTNDLGEYRLHLLPPGRYYISGRAENPNGQNGAFFVRKPNSIPMLYKEAVTPYVSHRVLENGEIQEFIDVPVYFPGTIDSEMATPFGSSHWRESQRPRFHDCLGSSPRPANSRKSDQRCYRSTGGRRFGRGCTAYDGFDRVSAGGGTVGR